MNKYNLRICYKHHNQRTSILIKFEEFIQKVLDKYNKAQTDRYMSK